MTPGPDPEPEEARLARTVGKYRERKEASARSFTAKIALVGSLGWIVVLPTLLGAWGGRWLDRRFESGVFWMAAGLMVGVSLGSYLLWKCLPGHEGE